MARGAGAKTQFEMTVLPNTHGADFIKGLDLFNRAHFFDAHEVLETSGAPQLMTSIGGGIFRAWFSWQSLFIMKALATIWAPARFWSAPCAI